MSATAAPASVIPAGPGRRRMRWGVRCRWPARSACRRPTASSAFFISLITRASRAVTCGMEGNELELVIPRPALGMKPDETKAAIDFKWRIICSSRATLWIFISTATSRRKAGAITVTTVTSGYNYSSVDSSENWFRFDFPGRLWPNRDNWE